VIIIKTLGELTISPVPSDYVVLNGLHPSVNGFLRALTELVGSIEILFFRHKLRWNSRWVKGAYWSVSSQNLSHT